VILKLLKNEKLYLILFWIVYIFLCLHFYLERSTFADNSYYLFEIIQNKRFCIQYDRYFSITTQWLPLLAVKFQMPLKVVLIAHSISPVVLNLIVFLLIRYLSSEKWFSYLYLLSISAFLHDAFFYVNDEMMQATSLLLLIPSVLRSSKLKRWNRIVILILLILILQTAHLFLMLGVITILSICFLEKKEKSILLAIAFVFVIIILKAVIFKSGRDSNSIDAIFEKMPNLKIMFSSPFVQFSFHAISKYYLIPILLLFVLYSKTSMQRGTIVISVGSFILLYFLLVIYLKNGAINAYMDRYLAVLLFLYCSILIYLSTDKLFILPVYPLIIVLAILFAFGQLFLEKSYTERITYLKTMMKNGPTKQIYLYEKMPENIKKLSWSVPYETLIISSLSPETKTILIKEPFYKIDDLIADNTIFLGAEWTFGRPITLDEKYFPLKKSLYTYQDNL
jgi:hypothetical protein